MLTVKAGQTDTVNGFRCFFEIFRFSKKGKQFVELLIRSTPVYVLMTHWLNVKVSFFEQCERKSEA